MQSYKDQFDKVYSLIDLALDLRTKFEITESKRWNITKSVMELGVQIGHLVTVISKTSNSSLTQMIEEENRSLNNIGDEIADCLFQILCIINKLNLLEIKVELDKFSVSHQKLYSFDITQLTCFLNIIFGQILESLMKINQMRFARNRTVSEKEFFASKLVQIMSIIFHMSYRYDIDLVQSFIKMKSDAEEFLSSYKSYSKKQKANSNELHLLNSLFNT